MLDDFMLRAILAGVGLSLVAGPLGSFVVWRRMAYFGDATAHAAILGVALALAFSISVTIGALVVALAVGLAVSALSGRGHSADTSIGVISHTALALGLVAISFVKGVRVDLNAFLFGDILTVTSAEVLWVWVGSILALLLLVWRWSALLTATLNEELAASAGINARREGMILTLVLAAVVAIALKLVGALLIAALLIVPAAAARGFARSPEMMAVLATVFGMLATVIGVFASYALDTPTGPTIVVAAGGLFALSLVAGSD
ncbi:MAG: metal ABC transporter permease [Marinosulfonomonas sp.]|nr:metal ABC transporter permease [Marinosulfonomonas sp.]